MARAFESKKVAIGVLSGVLGIAVLLALILMIVGKGDEPAARPQPVVAQQSKPVPPKPAPVEVQPQALLAERSLTEPRAVSTAVSTKQDPGKAGTSTADAQVPAESTPTLVQPESLHDVSDKSFLSLFLRQVNEKSEVMSIFLLTFVGRNYRLNHILKQELRPL